MVGISEAYLADLGRVVAAWSHVESQFHLLYLSMVVMRGAPTGQMNTKRARDLMGLSLERQLREFRVRLDEMTCTPATREKYERIFNQLVTLRNERDRVAHSQWTPHIEKTHQLTISPAKAVALSKSWKNFDPHLWTIVPQEKLKDIFERIEVLFWNLSDLQLQKSSDFPPPQPA